MQNQGYSANNKTVLTNITQS